MTTFDMALIQRGARLRRSPYFDATLRAGCRAYTVYNHMFLPTRYDDLHAEYERLRTGVTVWDVSVERQVEITGPDAFAFTNLLTPRDLSKCAVGQGKYVLITAEDGGIVNDPVLLRLGENHFWLALADSDVLLWAKGVALNSGLDVRLCEPDVSPMQVQGPKSKEVVRRLFGEGVAGLRYYWFAETDLDGIPVVVTRTGWSGEVGYEIYLRDGSRGMELWDRVMDAGADLAIAPTGPSDIRRIEAGILNYGIDMTLDTNPYEVGLGWQVDDGQEGDFIGREALARIAAEGPRRRLAGVEIAGAPLDLNMTRWPVWADGAGGEGGGAGAGAGVDGVGGEGGEAIGFVTSAVWSPRLKRNIGYATVPTAFAELGTGLRVATPDGDREAAVVPKPFVDPDKDIPKS
ncbi:MAG: glycine cleavage system protein T [Gemmatimonadetes bacterium]|nr:glycine cleavage system protein T [Gemmatimonadota bacterium]